MFTYLTLCFTTEDQANIAMLGIKDYFKSRFIDSHIIIIGVDERGN